MTSNPENIEGQPDTAVDFSRFNDVTSCSTFDMAEEPTSNKSGADAAVIAFQKDSVTVMADNHAWTSAEA
jgi:hypothetical protein